jgi:hypothetical protein
MEPNAYERTLQDWAKFYFRDLPENLRGADHITDKHPRNFEAAGLIARMLPNAIIVHVRRNPVETCLSVYRQEFNKNWTVAHRLADIAAYYARYAKLVGHWERVLPGRIVTIQYEDFVADFANAAPPLLQACGLEWQPQCLEGTASQEVPRAAFAAVALFVLAQVAASALRVESEPFISDFPMYADTWPSRTAFDERFRARHREYLISTSDLDADAFDARLRQLPVGVDAMRHAIDSLQDGALDDDGRQSLDAVARAYAERYGEPLGLLRVVVAERRFDWQRGVYEEPRREQLGVLDPATATLRRGD